MKKTDRRAEDDQCVARGDRARYEGACFEVSGNLARITTRQRRRFDRLESADRANRWAIDAALIGVRAIDDLGRPRGRAVLGNGKRERVAAIVGERRGEAGIRDTNLVAELAWVSSYTNCRRS